MRKAILLLGTTCLLSAGNALAQDWQWAVTHTTPQDAYGNGIAIDAQGNSYAIGSYFQSINFGSTVLNSAGSNDIFVTKHDADGNLLWAVSAGGTNQDLGNAIAVDADGNVLVTGTFRETANFGDQSITTGGTGTFIVKYDTDGNALWARAGTTTNSIIGNGIATDAAGNVYVTGYFLYSAAFGTTPVTTSGYRELFVVKYNAAGDLQWATVSDGSYFVQTNAIAADAAGNTVITGYFSDDLTVGSSTMSAVGNYDIFVIRLDADGNKQWGRQAGGSTTYFDEGYGVAMDAAGNAYVTGCFAGTSSFDDVTLAGSGQNNLDIFLAKYDASGDVIWARSAGSTGDDRGMDVSVDAAGNAYLAGYVHGNADFSGTPLPSIGNADIIVAKYAPDGIFQWVQQAGGNSVDHANGIAADATGNCYVTGSFRFAANFGSHQTNAQGSLSDFFVARLGVVEACEEPMILAQPVSITACADGGAALGVSATGTDLSFQWMKGTEEVGTDSPSLVFSSVSAEDEGDYHVIITGECGEVTSETVSITVNVCHFDWQWAVTHTTPQDAYGNGIAIDAQGNSYAIGSYFQSINFGSTVLNSAGSNDIFVTKHDADGNLLWAVSAGGTNQDLGNAIAVDADGNVLVTGTFRETANFGDQSITTGGTGTFIVKYDTDGNALWARAGTTTNSIIGNGIAVDATGNVYVTGYFLYSAAFGTTPVTTTGYRELFVVKYNAAGDLQWATVSDGSYFVQTNAIAADAAGNTVITGYFSDDLTVGSSTMSAVGNYDIFVIRLDADGNKQWGRQAGGSTTYFDEGYGVAMDAAGNAYVTGCFAGTSSFDDVTLAGSGQNNLDIFLAKYDASGDVIWARSAGSTGDDRGMDVSVDAAGNAYLAGYVHGNADFSGTPLPSIGNADIIVAKYAPDGIFQWVQQAGGNSVDHANGIAADATGNCYVTGSFRFTANFGSHQINAQGSLSDFFVAKVGSSIITSVLDIASSNTVTVYPNPTRDMLFVRLENGAALRVELYDILGNRVLSQNITDNRPIKVSHLPAGMYVLRTFEGSSMSTHRVVVQ